MVNNNTEKYSYILNGISNKYTVNIVQNYAVYVRTARRDNLSQEKFEFNFVPVIGNLKADSLFVM